jgi:hypothetical protein
MMENVLFVQVRQGGRQCIAFAIVWQIQIMATYQFRYAKMRTIDGEERSVILFNGSPTIPRRRSLNRKSKRIKGGHTISEPLPKTMSSADMKKRIKELQAQLATAERHEARLRKEEERARVEAEAAQKRAKAKKVERAREVASRKRGKPLPGPGR